MNASKNDNGIYFFLGNTTSHVTHALPLYKKVGGTFVTLSKKASRILSEIYNIDAINIDDIPYRWQRFGWKVKPIHEYDKLDSRADSTIDYLNANAKIVLFYDLFDFRSSRLNKPKKLFLTHGNMLKDYMGANDRINRLNEYDFMAAIGPRLKKQLMEKHGISESKLLDLGIARTDEFVNYAGKVVISPQIADELGIDPNMAIVSYVPTFWGTSSIHTTGFEILRNIPDYYTLIFRPHPQTPRKHLVRYIEYIQHSHKSIVYAPEGRYPDLHLTDLLKMSSVIIGDLSSVMIDAILIKKPLIFTYEKNANEEFAEYDMIKDIVQKSQTLDMTNVVNIESILERAALEGIDEDVWNKACGDLYFYPDGKSVQSIAKFITSQIA